ncbi:MAG: alpha-glucosidase/alpha-galactosidase [Spirochaetaceae bacterium]|nr:alpha-glucosidase/alpha-galactosidase [Spirochaetaceae bacterium]MCF7949469.1 alpha-glucosidase/alpha-galactosidase [Spirochaetia bacterium]MCF7950342.1 alpha-glucosidase/alpha-galactosidase [Spirochaetaceae bacterium]
MQITFLGAGSSIFAKNILGDVLLTPSLHSIQIHLYDIDSQRLEDSQRLLENLNQNINSGRAVIRSFCGVEQRAEALKGSDFVVNAIQVGGYDPATKIDFELPARYGLRQTIGDTLGIGGIFRGIRTLQVMFPIIREMEELCPRAILLNYANPMSIVTGALLDYSNISTVGLCHSVQVCVPRLLKYTGIEIDPEEVQWHIAGINHMAWLLSISHKGRDLYPQIRQRARKLVDHPDKLRLELMRRFGYYVTESSEHNAEYTPYWIKGAYPELIEQYRIPLDEYPRRCEQQIQEWEQRREELVHNKKIDHSHSYEYAAGIMDSVVTGKVRRIHANVRNRGLIPNLPSDAVVELPCLVDRNGVQGVYAGRIPTQCAALNRAAINVQQMTIEAALSGSRDALYQAALLDPHTAAELSIDQIVSLCDEMLAAHGDSCRIIQ